MQTPNIYIVRACIKRQETVCAYMDLAKWDYDFPHFMEALG